MKKKTTTTPSSRTHLDDLSRANPINKFYKIAAELSDLHHKKSIDYGTQGDTYQNFRGAERCGVPAWKGAFIRLMDKVQRVQKFAKDGKLANETVIDSFDDLAVYAIICRILYEETLDKNGLTIGRKINRKEV